MMKIGILFSTFSVLSFAANDNPKAVYDQAAADFFAARIEEATQGFDKLVKLSPGSAPQLWQRGIALYYAKRFGDCAAQFESHRTVNPNDVENAAWHFLCVARGSNPAQAKEKLLPVGPDSRVPMMQIYEMFRGVLPPEKIIAVAGSDAEAQFYAHLYAGLYLEATGKPAAAIEHIRIAANDRYRMGGYMHRVAQVHLALAQKASVKESEVWNFDRLDSIGGHKTTIRGNPRVIDTPIGKAIEFDGVDDAIFLEVHPLAGAETFTWEVIFRPDAGGGAEQRFFHLQERGTQTRMLFETRLIGAEWYLDSFVLSGKASKALIRPDRKHPLGQWQHAAMTYDGKQFRHYVNGELEDSAEIQFAPQGDGQTSVGVRINLKDYFKGAVHQARFTRRALSPAEFLRTGDTKNKR